jgi:predicted deacylase
MRIGNLSAQPGQHVYGEFAGPRSRSGLALNLPMHLFAGAHPGPTLLVQAAVHGNEIIGTTAILNVVQKLDPQQMHGNLIAVPVLNRIGFELQERLNRIDGKDILRCFPGRAHGSISEQLAHVYFHEVMAQANVAIDFHAGGRTAYERYVCYVEDKQPGSPSEIECKRHQLVVAFGLDAAGYFPRGIFAGSETEDAFEDAGIVLFTPELGGGTGWYEHGLENVWEAERGIHNTLKAMRILEGEFASDGPLCTIYNAGIVLWKPAQDGLFIRQKNFGDFVKQGEVYGTLQDPYTGEPLAQLLNTRDGTVIPSGQNWPTVGSTSVGILGVVDRVVDRRTTDLYVAF